MSHTYGRNIYKWCIIYAFACQDVGQDNNNNDNIFIYIAPSKTEFTKCFDRQSKGSTILKQRHMTKQ